MRRATKRMKITRTRRQALTPQQKRELAALATLPDEQSTGPTSQNFR